jgi:4-hydroxybenzoate polyprenyltransferase
MNPRGLGVLDYVFLLRPVILVPGWVFLVMGYHSGRAWGGEPASPWYPTGRLLLSLVVFTAIMGAIYILNQICDREADRLNRKLYLISEGRISLAAAALELGLLNGAAVLLAWAFFPPAYAALAVVSVISGIAYSVRPVRLKARAGWDIVANGVGFGGIAFVMGWLTGAPLHPVAVLRTLPYVLAVGAIHTNATVLDLEGDRAAGDNTIAVRLGLRPTLWLGTVLACGSLLAALALGETITFVWAGASAVAFAWAAWGAETGRSVTANQLSGRAFVLLQGLRFPYFLLWLAVVYGATKWYYRSRFGVDYPSLKDTRDPHRPTAESVVVR